MTGVVRPNEPDSPGKGCLMFIAWVAIPLILIRWVGPWWDRGFEILNGVLGR